MTGSTHEPEVHNFCLKVGNVLKAVVAGTDSDRRLSTEPGSTGLQPGRREMVNIRSSVAATALFVTNTHFLYFLTSVHP